MAATQIASRAQTSERICAMLNWIDGVLITIEKDTSTESANKPGELVFMTNSSVVLGALWAARDWAEQVYEAASEVSLGEKPNIDVANTALCKLKGMLSMLMHRMDGDGEESLLVSCPEAVLAVIHGTRSLVATTQGWNKAAALFGALVALGQAASTTLK